MKILINGSARLIHEMLEKFAMFSPGTALLERENVVIHTNIGAPTSHKVAALSEGENCHEPAHIGYVGGTVSAPIWLNAIC